MISNLLNRTTTKVSNSMTADELYSSLKGESTVISKNQAMSNSEIIFSCINLIANSIARMPFNVLRNTEKGKEKVSNDLSYLLKTRPNKFMTPSAFKKYIISQMLVYGESFIWIKTRGGRVVELLPLDSLNTRVETSNGKYLVHSFYDGENLTLNYEQVIHLRDGIKDNLGKRPISRVDIVLDRLNTMLTGDKLINDIYANGGQINIKGAITTSEMLNGDAKKLLKQAFMNVLNSDGSGVAVLDNGLDYKSISNGSISLVDTQYIDSVKYNRDLICSVFGLNSALIGATENTNYSNMVQIQRQFIESLTPMVINIEEEFSYKLIPSYEQEEYFIKVNLNSALRDDAVTRANYYSTMSNNGFMTRAEVRALEDLNFIQGTEELLIDLNKVPLSKYDEYLSKRYGTSEVIKVEEETTQE